DDHPLAVRAGVEAGERALVDGGDRDRLPLGLFAGHAAAGGLVILDVVAAHRLDVEPLREDCFGAFGPVLVGVDVLEGFLEGERCRAGKNFGHYASRFARAGCSSFAVVSPTLVGKNCCSLNITCTATYSSEASRASKSFDRPTMRSWLTSAPSLMSPVSSRGLAFGAPMPLVSTE